jgi:hypothetical protein
MNSSNNDVSLLGTNDVEAIIAELLNVARDSANPPTSAEPIEDSNAAAEQDENSVRSILSDNLLSRYNNGEIHLDNILEEYLAILRADSEEYVEQAEDYGMNPLMLASAFGHAGVVRDLVINAAVEVNDQAPNGDSALIRACTAENLEIVSFLIDNDADVNLAYNSGYTPLMSAVDHNKETDIIARLIEAGADVNARDEYGYNALSHAIIPTQDVNDEGEVSCITPDIKFAKILINLGADVLDIEIRDYPVAPEIVFGNFVIKLDAIKSRETLEYLANHQARLSVVAGFIYTNFISDAPYIENNDDNLVLLEEIKKFSKNDLLFLLEKLVTNLDQVEVIYNRALAYEISL